MKEPLVYIIETIVCSGLFYLLYQLFILRFTGFKVNRIFLLCGVFLSCFIPMMSIPIWEEESVNLSIAETMNILNFDYDVIDFSDENKYDIENSIVGAIYLLGFALLLLNHIIKLCRERLSGFSKVGTIEKTKIVEDKRIKYPFSFLKTIYLPIIHNEREKSLIIVHELSHIKHYHSYERIFLEVHKLVFWFNPFIWLSMRNLVEIQEMEADNDVINNGADITEYRMTLLKQVFGMKIELVCNLSGHPLKKRFLAMSIKRIEQNARILLLIPFMALALIVFAFVEKTSDINSISDTIDNVTVSNNGNCIVSGMIMDKVSEKPIIGAIVKDLKSSKGVVTDIDGKFSVNIPKGSTLSVIYPNYTKTVIFVGNDDEQIMNISLEPEIKKYEVSTVQQSYNQQKRNQLFVLVEGKPYNSSIDKFPSDRIKEIIIVKESHRLKPYIEKYGEVARSGVMEIQLKK